MVTYILVGVVIMGVFRMFILHVQPIYDTFYLYSHRSLFRLEQRSGYLIKFGDLKKKIQVKYIRQLYNF